MSGRTDKQRIIALQKALKIARNTLLRYRHDAACEEALYEIDKLDWKSKPSGLQGICGHGNNVQ